MDESLFEITPGEGPLVAAAVHDGQALRSEVAPLVALGEMARLREEDPFTAEWTMVAPTRIVGRRSRFEVDLNRPREKAVYLTPDDAWGLNVWRSPPPDDVVARSLAGYDQFYQEVHGLLTEMTRRWGRVVVFDLHSYNHRRTGPDGPPADPETNPEVNLGVGSLDRERWGSLVDRFIADLSGFDFLGRRLDVRENVKFLGGGFPRWIHASFPETVCALAIEFKKFFMDEWTGEPDRRQVDAVRQALASTVPGVLETLERLR